MYTTNDEYKFKDMQIAMLQNSWTPQKNNGPYSAPIWKMIPYFCGPEIFVELLRQARNEFHELHPQIWKEIIASHQQQCNLPENI